MSFELANLVENLTTAKTLSIPVTEEAVWYELIVPDVAATPGPDGLLDLLVDLSASEMPGPPIVRGRISIEAIRVEETPSSLAAWDVEVGGRYACTPVRALPAQRFFPGERGVDSFRQGPEQGVWNDRRSAVSNALFRASDHLCIHVADSFPQAPSYVEEDRTETSPMMVPIFMRRNLITNEWMMKAHFLRGTPHLARIIHSLPGIRENLPTSPISP